MQDVLCDDVVDMRAVGLVGCRPTALCSRGGLPCVVPLIVRGRGLFVSFVFFFSPFSLHCKLFFSCILFICLQHASLVTGRWAVGAL